MAFETVIGLEVHAQLKTASKVFCSCPVVFGEAPNTAICPVCTGQPGALPVLSRRAVLLVARTGIALGCRINPRSIFARKQYFYPDMPKNYQISQYELPIAENGSVSFAREDGSGASIRVLRIHLEEDAGKLLHAQSGRAADHSLVDLNRASVPLMEIVSQPDLRTSDDAVRYLETIKEILEYLGVSDCDMEEGKFRCDANISLRPAGQAALGVKAEIKNMNSLAAVRAALDSEIARQTEVLAAGGRVVQETRLWDPDRGETSSMRSKEEAHDYRYFPDPDLVPVVLAEEELAALRADLPELPSQRRARLMQALGLGAYDAGVITSSKALADYFEAALDAAAARIERPAAAKPLANWLTSELLGRLNSLGKTIGDSPVAPAELAALVVLIREGAISGKTAKSVFDTMIETGRSAAAIVAESGLAQISDRGALEKLCAQAIAENPRAVAEFKAGKERALGAIVGTVMKLSKGQANPALVNTLLKELMG